MAVVVQQATKDQLPGGRVNDVVGLRPSVHELLCWVGCCYVTFRCSWACDDSHKGSEFT